MPILKRALRRVSFFTLLFAGISLAAEEIDAEIVKNLDLYMNMEVIQHLDLAMQLDDNGALRPTPAKAPTPVQSNPGGNQR